MSGDGPRGLSLSCVVPATNDPATLGRCLAAIRSAEATPEELIVVGTADRPGPSSARNAGAKKASGDVIVFVDADVVVHADAFVGLRSRFARDGGLAAVFGSYDDRPAGPGVVSRFRNLLHHHVHQESAGEVASFWGAIGAIRRPVFERLGGFDEAGHPRCLEDIELGMRMADSGERVLLASEVQGKHLKRWTLGSMIATDFGCRALPWLRLILERRRPGGALNLGWRHLASAAASLAAAAFVLARRPIAAVLALAVIPALHPGFYRLLARRLGPGGALASVGLHAIHHLSAIAAVPVALVQAGAALTRDR